MSENPYQSPNIVAEAKPKVSQKKLILASLWHRFAGAFIDSVLLAIVILPLSFLLALPGVNALFPMGETPEFNIVFLTVAFVIGQAAFLMIQGYLLATRGQTVGKYVVKTQILDENTNQVPEFFGLYFKRYLILAVVAYIPLIGGYVSLVDALLIFRQNRKCMHDDIAGTKVVLYRP